MTFGEFIRTQREARRETARCFSVRQVAKRIDIEPSYLSKIERGRQPPPSEDTIRKLAEDLGENADVLLAMAGKVSGDLRDVIIRRPELFSELLRQLKDTPDHAVLRVVRVVRDGAW